MHQLMPPILSDDLILSNFVPRPSFAIFLVQENSLEDMVLKGHLGFFQLILEVTAVETHF
jgi:hypothetical protein